MMFTAICLLTLGMMTSAQTLEEGKQHFYYERYTSAEAALQGAVKQDPANSEAWLWLTRLYLLRDSAKAASSLALAPASIQQEPFYLIARGAILLNKRKLPEARIEFEKAIDDTKGKNTSVLAAIADVEIDAANGDLAYATDVLQRAIKRDKKNAGLYTSLGRAYRKLHDGTKSFQAFKEAIDKDKQAAAAYYELGELFVTQKNADLYLDYFSQAVNADKQYGPAYYALYDHYLYLKPAIAKEYFQQYAAHADKDLQQTYSYTDLLYLNNKYDSAIQCGKDLLTKEGTNVQPRIYKLIAYSYQGKGDSASALGYMKDYFGKEVDSNFVVKDYETMANLYATEKGKEDSAIAYLEKAVSISTDSTVNLAYYQNLARLSKSAGDYTGEARWLGRLYMANPRATNVMLFNWGLAAYKSEDYHQADSVFGIYTSKYPEQGFGYYWRARSNVAIDTAMEMGLAIPHYQKLIEVINKDSMSATDKKWIKESYSYLASYEANMQKDYEEAIGYFEKLLEIDPANDQAQKYIDILEKNLEAKNKNDASAGAGSK